MATVTESDSENGWLNEKDWRCKFCQKDDGHCDCWCDDCGEHDEDCECSGSETEDEAEAEKKLIFLAPKIESPSNKMSKHTNMSSQSSVFPESSVPADKWEEWEEVYNSTDERQGEPREHSGQPGTFYQTYGNGGGENGWGGYWVRKDTTAVWTVAGQVFKYLDNYILEYKPKDRMRGNFVARCRVYVPKPENPTCCMCSKTCENEWGNNPAPVATKGVCCNECNQKVILVRMGMLKINKDGEYEFIPMKVKLGRVGRLGED